MKKNIIIALLSILLLASAIFPPISLVTPAFADTYASVKYVYDAESLVEKVGWDLDHPAGVHAILITPYNEDGYTWAVVVVKEPPE